MKKADPSKYDSKKLLERLGGITEMGQWLAKALKVTVAVLVG